VGITVGYGFGNNNFFATVNASAYGFYGYAGYDTKGGFIAGGGFGAGYFLGMGGSMYSGKIGFSISTNVLEIGFSYAEHGGWSANVCGYQYTRNGVIFDPSIGGGFNFAIGRQQQVVVANDHSLEELAAMVKVTIPEVQLADGAGGLLPMPGPTEHDAVLLREVVVIGHRTATSSLDYPGGVYLHSSDVRISFDRGANHMVNAKLENYLLTILSLAQDDGIESIGISSTTNHSKISASGNVSAHSIAGGAVATDINYVNGVHVSKNNPWARILQRIINNTSGYRENYGPFLINKMVNGKETIINSVRNTVLYPDGHFRHIHMSVYR